MMPFTKGFWIRVDECATDAITYLNPVVTAAFRNRRRNWMRITSGAVAATIIVCVSAWLFAPRESAFAQTVAAINKAESITWTITWYNRWVSQDGKRTWLRKLPRWERSYLAPGSHRDVRYDDAGNITTVDPKLFSLTPPADFKVVEAKARSQITEDLLIDWFRVSARANGHRHHLCVVDRGCHCTHPLYSRPLA